MSKFTEENMERESLSKKQIMELILFFGIVLVAVLNIEIVLQIGGYIVRIFYPFTLGAAIAFVLHVPMRFFEKKLLSRWIKSIKVQRIISCLMTLILLTGIIFAIIILVIPEMVEAVNTLISRAPAQFRRLQAWIEPYFHYVPLLEEWINENLSNINWQEMLKNSLEFLSYGAGSIFNSTVGIISSVAARTLSILIGVVFAIYVLFEQENLKRQGKKIVYGFFKEDKADEIVHVMEVSNRTFSNFISGQVLEAIILGTLFWITLGVFKFPYALLIGVLISVTALIPIVGAFIGCAIGAFLMVVIDPMLALWFLIVFIILQQIEGNLIYPFVVGNKIGIPSMWVLMAVTIGGSLMGITGILIFIPLFSVVYTLLKEKSNKRLKLKKVSREKWAK